MGGVYGGERVIVFVFWGGEDMFWRILSWLCGEDKGGWGEIVRGGCGGDGEVKRGEWRWGRGKEGRYKEKDREREEREWRELFG